MKPNALRFGYFSHEFSTCRHWVGLPNRTTSWLPTPTLRVLHATYCSELRPFLSAGSGTNASVLETLKLEDECKRRLLWAWHRQEVTPAQLTAPEWNRGFGC
jgi:hypothetical protein